MLDKFIRRRGTISQAAGANLGNGAWAWFATWKGQNVLQEALLAQQKDRYPDKRSSFKHGLQLKFWEKLHRYRIILAIVSDMSSLSWYA
jgi:hypothetical protein